MAVAIVSGCGSGGRAAPASSSSPRPRTVTTVVARHDADTVTVSLQRGRRTAVVHLREPQGAIQRYEISAPAGTAVRAWSQIPHVTVPLAIRTSVGTVAGCRRGAGRIVCTQGEEGCPMPSATWRIRIEKLAGPAGAVTIRLQIGTRRRGSHAMPPPTIRPVAPEEHHAAVLVAAAADGAIVGGVTPSRRGRGEGAHRHRHDRGDGAGPGPLPLAGFDRRPDRDLHAGSTPLIAYVLELRS
jgi:hypothetical protein